MNRILGVVGGFAAVLGSWAVSAVEPIAVWDGACASSDFSSLVRGEYAWTPSAGTTVASDAVTIGADGGLVLEAPANSAMRTGRKATVILKLAEIPETDVTIYSLTVNGSQVSLDSQGDTAVMHWNRGGNYGSFDVDRTHALRVAYAFEGASGKGSSAFVDGEKRSAPGLMSSSGGLTKLAIGQYTGATPVAAAEGMVVSAIALFDAMLTDAEVAAYKFPSEVSDHVVEGVAGTVAWEDISFSPAWSDGATQNAVVNLSGDATIAMPSDLQAYEIRFVGPYAVTLTGSANLNVNHIVLEDGATVVERPITTAEAAGAVSVPADRICHAYGDFTATASVAAGGKLVVESGTATLGGAGQALRGTLEIAAGATVVASSTDWPSYDNGCTIDVSGTLDMSNVRWTFFPTDTLRLRAGGRIVTDVASSAINGGASLDAWNGFVLDVVGEPGGVAELSAVYGPTGASTTNVVAEGMTLVLSAKTSANVSTRTQGFYKAGPGLLKVTGDLSTQAKLEVLDGELEFAEGAVAPKAIVGAYKVTAASGIVVSPAVAASAHVAAGGKLVVSITNDELMEGLSLTVAELDATATVTFVDPAGHEFEALVDGCDVTLPPFAYTFTGAAGDGNWSTAENWLGELLPGAGNVVTLVADVTVDADVSVAGVDGNVTVTIPEGRALTYTGTANVTATVLGSGTLRLEGNGGSLIPTVAGLTDPAWTGTVELKNLVDKTSMNFVGLGHAGSAIVCAGVQGWFQATNPAQEVAAKVTLEQAAAGYGLNIKDGSSGIANVVTFNALAGTGKLLANGGSTAGFLVRDWAEFSGSVEAANKTIVFGTTKRANENRIVIEAGQTVTVATNATWSATGNGILVEGTLVNNGMLASAVKGSGEVVYFGSRFGDEYNRLPQDAVAAAYTNEAWTGTVTLKNWGKYDERAGANHNHARESIPAANVLATWCNANSRIKFTGVIGYLPNGATYNVNLVLEDNDGEYLGMPYAWHNDSGGSGNTTTIAKLSGAGTFYDSAVCTHVVKFADANDFTGAFKIMGKRICLGAAATVPSSGGISVAAGQTLATVGQTWTAPGGVTLAEGATVAYAGAPLALADGTALTATGAVGVEIAEGASVIVPLRVLSGSVTLAPSGAFVAGETVPAGLKPAVKADGLVLRRPTFLMLIK